MLGRIEMVGDNGNTHAVDMVDPNKKNLVAEVRAIQSVYATVRLHCKLMCCIVHPQCNKQWIWQSSTTTRLSTNDTTADIAAGLFLIFRVVRGSAAVLD
jgi:hypothetical protein